MVQGNTGVLAHLVEGEGQFLARLGSYPVTQFFLLAHGASFPHFKILENAPILPLPSLFRRAARFCIENATYERLDAHLA